MTQSFVLDKNNEQSEAPCLNEDFDLHYGTIYSPGAN
jgi:hypothetical protein